MTVSATVIFGGSDREGSCWPGAAHLRGIAISEGEALS